MKKTAIRHLKDASDYISKVITMLENDSNFVEVFTKSKEVQFHIHLAKKLLLENYFQKCLTEYYKGNNEKKS